MIRSEVRELLRAVYDIERLMTKVILEVPIAAI